MIIDDKRTLRQVNAKKAIVASLVTKVIVVSSCWGREFEPHTNHEINVVKHDNREKFYTMFNL